MNNIRKLPCVFFFHFTFRHKINTSIFTNVVPFEFYLLGYDTVLSGKSKALLAAYFMLVSYMANSSNLKMEVICSSETPINFHWTTQHYIPEDRILHNHCCENLKSNIMQFIFQLSQLSIKLYDCINNFTVLKNISTYISI
jgi:hypothetical protein